jgi:hypothetical protein
MQSGRAKTLQWALEFAPAAARLPDPLTGWTQTTDTDGQVRLSFESREAAVEYAQRRGLPFEVLPDPDHKPIIRAYADNFSFGRKQPWTH